MQDLSSLSKEPERCIERKWGDGSLKEKWIQPEMSTTTKQTMVLLKNTLQPGSSEEQIQVNGTHINLNKCRCRMLLEDITKREV
jgi:hypothetical protein